jgi:HK97 family phage prohead protease
MKVNLPITLTAADTQTRTLTGRIVTWGEEGFTSAGKTIFAKDSITIPKNVKLLLEHDRTRPIGKLTSYEVTDIGIEASFKIAGTIAGDDSLLEAAEGLRDGFSVGIKLNQWDNKDGAMVISSSQMIETSLVTDPAIDSARVTEVAATETEVSESKDSDIKPEGEDLVSETAPESVTTEAVEAAKSEVTVSASAPVMYSSPRVNLNVSAGQVAKAQLAASRGDSDARDLGAQVIERLNGLLGQRRDADGRHLADAIRVLKCDGDRRRGMEKLHLRVADGKGCSIAVIERTHHRAFFVL